MSRGNLEQVLGGPWRPAEPDPPDIQLRLAMTQLDLDPPTISMDGQLHRFKVGTSSDAGWYVAYGDGVPAGMFGNWKTGEQVSWRADIGRELTTAEQMAHSRHLAQLREQRDRELKAKRKVAADTVSQIWELAGLASDEHPYLQRKGVKAHGLRITGDGRLIAPLYDQSGELSSLQYISSDGGKQFHAGGAVKGSYYTMGEIVDTVYIAEGFATAATIHEVTGKPVVAAYSAGNMVNVTEHLRSLSPSLSITIVADHDASGVGQSYAEQAAAKFGATVVIPPVEGDANDFAQNGGDLLSLLEPPKEDHWLMWMDEFCEQPSPIRWLVKHWIQDNAMIMVHGPSGCGKTFLVLDWCMRIASGQEAWCGEKVRPGDVIYLAGEGHHGLRGRAAAWKQTHHPDHLDMAISRGGTDLNTPEGLHKAISSIRSIKSTPSLIVVDTLHRFLNGDENSAQDTKTMLDACAVLMDEFSCSVLLVHHTGVSQEAQHRARGSSAWKGALDIEISVEKKERDPHMKIIQRKNKDSELAQDKHVELSTVPIDGWLDEDGEQVTSAVIVEGEAPVSDSPYAGKITEDVMKFTAAWEYRGSCEMVDGTPYLTRSAWKNYMIEEEGKSKTAASQAVKSAAGGIAKRMLNAGIIEQYQAGYIVKDGTISAHMVLGTNGTK